MDDHIGWYLKNAGRIPLLTPAEEIELGHVIQKWQRIKDQPDAVGYKKICRRGKRAFDRMYTANLRLVVDISRKYVGCVKTMELQDLIQEGNLGLFRAVEKFDPERGYKFSTYAYWWIRQGVRRAMSTQERVIRLPINCIDVQAKVARFVAEYQRIHGRTPTVELCAEHCEVRIHTMRAYLEHMQAPTSLDQNCQKLWSNGISPLTLLDLVPDTERGPDEEAEINNCLAIIDTYLDQLGPQEAAILKHRYGIAEDGTCKTLSEIGRILDLSRERVRQIELRALKKLRRQMVARADQDLAG